MRWGRSSLGLLLAGALLAEPGHAVAYALRQRALALPAATPHAYFRAALEANLAAP